MDEKNTQFEQELNNSAELLTTARERYDAFEGSIRIEFIEALSKIEEERNELKTKINVDETVQATARGVTQRAQLLSRFLRLITEYENNLIEHDLYRQQCWVDQIDREGVRSELTATSIELLDDISQWVQIFQNLIASESHDSIRTNSQKTISELEQDIRTTDHHISKSIPSSLYETVCSDTTDVLLDGIHDRLSEIEKTHPQREAFGVQLQTVKSMRSSTNPDAPRVALEGTLMILYEVSRVICRQEHAKRLATAIEETAIHPTIDPPTAASRADVDALLDVVTNHFQEWIEGSRSDQLRRVLTQHNGSVRRTLDATNRDAETLFEQLRILYEDDKSKDLVIRIKT